MKVLVCTSDIARAQEGRAHIYACAARHGVEVQVHLVESGEKLLFYQDTKFAHIDLLYISYELSGMNGFETARTLRKRGFDGDIIFYSVDASHAVDGYRVEALSYLIQGRENREDFESSFMKAVRRVRYRETEMISLQRGGERRQIPIQDILYFEVIHRIITVHYRRDDQFETFDFYSSLAKLEKQLEGRGLIRVHRSFLVAPSFIYKKTTDSLEMANGDVLPVTKK